MMDDKKIRELLIENHIVPNEKLEKIVREAKEHRQSLLEYLVKEKVIAESYLYELYATALGIPFVNLGQRAVRKDILDLIPEPIAQTHKILAFDETEDGISIAATDPKDLEIFDFIRKKTGREVQIFLTAPSILQEVLKQYHKGLEAEVKELTDEEPSPTDSGELKKLARDLPIVRVMETILEYAIFEDASDIHIEPAEKDVIIRYRIDGILRDVMKLPKQSQAGIVARIKVLSNLKLDEHRLPQDGRFKIRTNQVNVSFRVSIIPVFHGEKVVLRLLQEDAEILTLEELGLLSTPLRIIKQNIRKPHGMILVTGPTGSGKTTTLYTILNMLNTPKVNILTVEDPIEYQIPRINQTQVNPKIGLTFAQGLRALLRQDPNIIMIGEIRDHETAEIGVHSAMTGHLVLSSLHTNDAVGAVPRLSEMGIPPFLIASTVNIIIAQRLVRKICVHCIESYNLTPAIVKEIEHHVDFSSLLSVLEREGIIQSAKVSMNSLLFYRGHGCHECRDEGYKGRIGIYEVLEVTKEIAEKIVQRATPEELFELAKKQKMMTIVQDGFVKAKSGITTIEEVLRVTKE